MRPREAALILVVKVMAPAEQATTVEALKLKLEIALTERATAEARTREAELKAQAPAAPAASAPKALPKRFLLPGDFADVVSGALFPKGGAGVQGEPQVLQLYGDEALAGYVSTKSRHAAWTYRRLRSVKAYFELVDCALRDCVTNAKAVRFSFDAVLAIVPKLSGTADEQRKAIEDLNAVAAEARRVNNPARLVEETCERASNTSAGTLELLADAVEFLYVKGAPEHEVSKHLKQSLLNQLLGLGDYSPDSKIFKELVTNFKTQYHTQLGKAAATKVAGAAAGGGKEL